MRCANLGSAHSLNAPRSCQREQAHLGSFHTLDPPRIALGTSLDSCQTRYSVWGGYSIQWMSRHELHRWEDCAALRNTCIIRNIITTVVQILILYLEVLWKSHLFSHSSTRGFPGSSDRTEEVRPLKKSSGQSSSNTRPTTTGAFWHRRHVVA